MDTANEVRRFRLLLFGVLMFLVSCYFTYGELAYLLRGKQTQATVTNAYPVKRGGRFGVGGRTAYTVEYAFTEPDGTRRADSDTVAAGEELQPNTPVMVQFTPGKTGRSRLAGHVNWFGPVFFVISLVVVIVFAWRLWSEATEAARERKPKRRR